MQNKYMVVRDLFLACLLIPYGGTAIGAQANHAGQADQPADLAAIQDVASGIIAADNTGDAVAVMWFYADDAILLPPNGAPGTGKDAIRTRYQRSRHDGGQDNSEDG